MNSLVVIVVLVLAFCGEIVINSEIVNMQNGYRGLDEVFGEPRIKKPFCNAFTGCGRKRSDENSNYININREIPDFEQLARKIFYQAKLLDRMRQAQKEFFRKENEQREEAQIRGEAIQMPLAFRKKRMTG